MVTQITLLKWDSTAITAQHCFFLADTLANGGVDYTKPRTGSYGTQRMTVGDHRSAVEARALCWLGYGCAAWAQAAI